jgi:hypothetical protein
VLVKYDNTNCSSYCSFWSLENNILRFIEEQAMPSKQIAELAEQTSSLAARSDDSGKK